MRDVSVSRCLSFYQLPNNAREMHSNCAVAAVGEAGEGGGVYKGKGEVYKSNLPQVEMA